MTLPPPSPPAGRTWPRRLLLLLWLGVIVGLSSWPNPQAPITPPTLLDRLLPYAVHFTLYAVLGLLIAWNLSPWARQRVHPLLGIVLVGLLGCLWGMLDEWYQGFIPGRYPSWEDVGVDTLGAFVGGWAGLWLLPRLLAPWRKASSASAGDPPPKP
ncbi:MAG: VanZ family protein [Dehalococcoidia bacterium]|nr:VanZ family protein [Dehalococcoidia bacterium]MDW8119467.1 VanZ family protein [Chloroflexota bacterium]